MLRKIWIVSIVLMLLSISIVPAIAAKDRADIGSPQGQESASEEIAGVTGVGEAATEAVNMGIQVGAVRYGPISHNGGAQYYYIGWGGSFTGSVAPVVVAGLGIPYSSAGNWRAQFSISTLSNYCGNSYCYAVVTEDYPYSWSLTGSYISLIGVKIY